MSSAITELVSTLRATAQRHAMFAPGQTVVVAISGGPDSTALLHALAGLRDEWQLNLVAAHLNHGLRGAEADADSDYVAALCKRLGIAVHIAHADVPHIRQRRHASTQEAAREARRAFLRRVAEQTGAARIALGHTRDDRVETILINLLRGTGPEGLSGFPAIDGLLVRPLYDVPRAQTIAYCADHALEPRADSSNAKSDYQRNRIRSELLPYLMSYYNERVDAALLRMAELISADNTVLEGMAADFLAEADPAQSGTEVILDGAALAALPLALQRRALRQAIKAVRGHLQGVSFEMVVGALQAVAQRAHYAITLPVAGTQVVRVQSDSGALRIFEAQPPSCPLPWSVPLQVPGQTPLPQAGLSIEAVRSDTVIDPDALRKEIRSGGNDGTVLALRLDRIALPLTARSWRPGDRMKLSGRRGSKKLQDLFVDAHVPAARRARVPVVTDANGSVLGVLGVAAAEISGLLDLQADAADAWLALIASPLDNDK